MFKKSEVLSISLVIALSLLGGCARNISSSSYDARTIGSASTTYECVVVSSRIVTVEEGDYLGSGGTGVLVGGIAGGAIGNAIGGGRGRVLTTIGGGLLGATAGAMAEKNMKSQNGIEYVVRLQSGDMKTVVQGLDNRLNPGQKCFLIVTNRGRSRLIAR